MNLSQEKEEIREEIKKEFQLERMILFSDAVFAIVITLMAIEIHLPESEHSMTRPELISALKHLLPVILSYIISYTFIGTVWYQHLKIFGLLKSFDGGLVLKNLFLLFFVGLFPFSSMVISRGPKGDMFPFVIYFLVIGGCIFALTLIENHIFKLKPHLRNKHDITDFLKKYEQRKFSLLLFLVILILGVITDQLITDPNLKFISTYWTLLIPIAFIIKSYREKKRQNK